MKNAQMYLPSFAVNFTTLRRPKKAPADKFVCV